jgi:hypothetical protein
MADYATLTQVKQAITDHGFDSPKGDDNLSRLLTAASRAVDRYVSRTRQRTFAHGNDVTRTFNVLNNVIGKTLYLHTDLCAVTTVSNDGTTTTDYTLESDYPHTTCYARIRLKTGAWTYSASTYPDAAASITGKFAYSLTPPDDIIQATIQLCVMIWRQKNTVANINSAMISADGTLIMPDGLPKSVVDLIEPYVV